MRNLDRALSIGIVALLALTACGGTPEAEPTAAETSVSSSPTVEAVVEPSETVGSTPSSSPNRTEPTQSKSATDLENGGELTAAELREMPLDDYLALSAVKREPLITYMLEESIDWAGTFGEHWEGDVSELYKYNPLEIASIDNTAEEIAMQHLYWTQLALMQTEDLGLSSTFDPDLATKALAGGFTHINHVSQGGESNLDGNTNTMFTHWQSIMGNLGTFTSHDYVQELTSAKFTDKSTVTDHTDGKEYLTVGISFNTGELPETLDSHFKEGTTTHNRMGFVWNEDVEQWQQYTGIVQNVSKK